MNRNRCEFNEIFDTTQRSRNKKTCSNNASTLIIIPLKYHKLHKRQFLQLEEEFAGIGFTIDHNCSDVYRLRCLSYDEAPYINEDAVTHTGVHQEAKQQKWQSRQRNSFSEDTD